MSDTWNNKENHIERPSISRALITIAALAWCVPAWAESTRETTTMDRLCRETKSLSETCFPRSSLNIVDRCKAQLKEFYTDATYFTLLATCEEAAAQKQPPSGAKQRLLDFAKDHRRLAKPGVAIGMTTQQVMNETRWGEPHRRNITQRASTVEEQWIYDYGYLYFQNGRLVLVQIRR